MEYTALIFDDCLEACDSYENLVDTINVYKEEDACKQIIVSCKSEWLLKLALSPISKVLLVQMPTKPYMALLSGLKAVTEENVLVNGLSKIPSKTDIENVLKELSQYPAIYMDKDLQGYDTRLLMFSLQVAIEQNLAIDTYAKAVEALGSTPLQYIKKDEA